MILSLEETKEWLRIDGSEDDGSVQMLIAASENYLKNATGTVFDHTHDQARLFCLVLVTDWYESRELTASKVGEKVRFTVQSMLLQLSNC
ncbi:head-tail connector protein [Sporosarcina sp. E16_8]|uniref:head-tail connector protein n=1 Tax=Sporosarcina sp. E16_8 TaxID=2789295 RepID=UPI001A93611F|nr:head-tail connector protein [Sporosarcina sp. E16_8]MBO0586121.1 phage gp6-like head-tail connector protein [Sporosarcina sp. E16_8]